jgi:DNA-binding response OmpR family regulator
MARSDVDPPVRVLLLEDDAGDAVLTREALRDAGADVALERAESVGDAERGPAQEADCVLLDLSLPDARGPDVVRRVRAVAPDAAIIVHTGLDDDRRRAEALAAGAQDYVVKGTLEGAALAAVIDAAIARRRRETRSGV